MPKKTKKTVGLWGGDSQVQETFTSLPESMPWWCGAANQPSTRREGQRIRTENGVGEYAGT